MPDPPQRPSALPERKPRGVRRLVAELIDAAMEAGVYRHRDEEADFTRDTTDEQDDAYRAARDRAGRRIHAARNALLVAVREQATRSNVGRRRASFPHTEPAAHEQNLDETDTK